MVNRSEEKSRALRDSLKKEFPQAEISWYLCDLEDPGQVASLCRELKALPIDVLMLNAGTYAIPRALSSAGYDTVFETNFLSHYRMVKALLPVLKARQTKVVATGSIAHRFHLSDPEDIDFANHSGANDIYGNSKRYLMFALMELLQKEKVPFAVGHPGICFTGITSHYPPKLLKIVRFSMRLLFMHPEKACRSMVEAVFTDVPYLYWIGPGIFDIWGNPRMKALTSCDAAERTAIFEQAEKICGSL